MQKAPSSGDFVPQGALANYAKLQDAEPKLSHNRRSLVLTGRADALGGVVSGYYPESETNFSLPAARVLMGEVQDNSGIASVVPGDEL